MKFPMGRFFWIIVMTLAAVLQGMAQTKIDEHWSGYDYPSEIPAGVKVHIIVEGDTLWGIAGTYLGDPLLWPQVFQANDYIKDPDLIYPGDPVSLDVGVVVNQDTIAQSVDDDTTPGVGAGEEGEFAELADAGEVTGDEDLPLGDDDTGAGEDVGEFSDISDFGGDGSEFVILPAGDRSDMECSTYLYPISSAGEILPFDLIVSGGEDGQRTNFSQNDVVYLNKGLDDGVTAGEIYSIRRQIENVYGVNGKLIGAAVDQVGKLRVLAVQENNATAIVSRSCFEAKVGDFLVPYEQEPIPLITELPSGDRYRAFSTEGSGFIVYSEDKIMSFGNGHLINIDLGIDSNVAPGDIFIVYRDNPANNPSEGIDLPEIYIGHAVALRASANSSVVKVIDAYTEMHVGDRVVLLQPDSFNP